MLQNPISNAGREKELGKKFDGCMAKGCLSILVIIAILIIIAVYSDPDNSTPRNRDDDILTDDEYENKPYDELSEEEKKQAIERIGKDVGAADGN